MKNQGIGNAIYGLLVLSLMGFGLAGCTDLGFGGPTASGDDDDDANPERAYPAKLEESDIYQWDNDHLFIQNTHSGLNVVDVTNPSLPLHVSQLGEVRGEAGELYVDGDRVFVLFDGQEWRCPLSDEFEIDEQDTRMRSELISTVGAPDNPQIADRLCLAGDRVASRKRGNILFLVTADEHQTWVTSVDAIDPANLAIVDVLRLPWGGREIHASLNAIFVAQGDGIDTTIHYVDITDDSGALVQRGSARASGVPQGRFHMDAFGDTFRIVTSAGPWQGTNLTVIDTSDPDYLVVMGQVQGLAPNEELWATRFVGHKAYVVTYLRNVPVPKDPLWVIDLQDPYSPEVQGELEIPGWSNFLYPRGDQLLAVGRGDRGAHVAVSLFDVSDPYNPGELRRIEFGTPDATAEASSDFRGVQVIEPSDPNGKPIVVVPYTNNLWSNQGCRPAHSIQLIDIEAADLTLRGSWEPEAEQAGRVRRTLSLDNLLYSISERGVNALHMPADDKPDSVAYVDLAGGSFSDECVTTMPDGVNPTEMWGDDTVEIGCHLGPTPAGRTSGLAGGLLLLGVVLVRRRKRLQK